ncbi:MAG: ABC transporter permease, partial [Bryobacteraceae bacterium]|nr:ABC transporter permease [Bryobacteraceae bacterium]
FLTIMGTPILSGRDLGPQEGLHSPRVVVVNEKLAQKFFDGHAVGRQLNDATIIGVAADVKYDRLRSEIPPTAYFPWRQQAERLAGVNFSIRTNVDPVSLVAAVRRAVAEIDSTLPVFNVRSQRQQIDMGIQRERTFAALAMFFSGVAVLLACIGIYGVLAYAVSRRTGEFGIRLALGATPGGISWLVVRGMLMPLIFAVAVGVPAALGAFSLFKAMLFGVNPDDPTTLAGAVAVIALCAAVAALIPGRRAARCDPAIALRYD